MKNPKSDIKANAGEGVYVVREGKYIFIGNVKYVHVSEQAIDVTNQNDVPGQKRYLATMPEVMYEVDAQLTGPLAVQNEAKAKTPTLV